MRKIDNRGNEKNNEKNEIIMMFIMATSVFAVDRRNADRQNADRLEHQKEKGDIRRKRTQ